MNPETKHPHKSGNPQEPRNQAKWDYMPWLLFNQ